MININILLDSWRFFGILWIQLFHVAIWNLPFMAMLAIFSNEFKDAARLLLKIQWLSKMINIDILQDSSGFFGILWIQLFHLWQFFQMNLKTLPDYLKFAGY